VTPVSALWHLDSPRTFLGMCSTSSVWIRRYVRVRGPVRAPRDGAEYIRAEKSTKRGNCARSVGINFPTEQRAAGTHLPTVSAAPSVIRAP
jgi:hypothetical protein